MDYHLDFELYKDYYQIDFDYFDFLWIIILIIFIAK
jgi:hypothetical protein